MRVVQEYRDQRGPPPRSAGSWEPAGAPGQGTVDALAREVTGPGPAASAGSGRGQGRVRWRAPVRAGAGAGGPWASESRGPQGGQYRVRRGPAGVGGSVPDGGTGVGHQPGRGHGVPRAPHRTEDVVEGRGDQPGCRRAPQSPGGLHQRQQSGSRVATQRSATAVRASSDRAWESSPATRHRAATAVGSPRCTARVNRRHSSRSRSADSPVAPGAVHRIQRSACADVTISVSGGRPTAQPGVNSSRGRRCRSGAVPRPRGRPGRVGPGSTAPEAHPRGRPGRVGPGSTAPEAHPRAGQFEPGPGRLRRRHITGSGQFEPDLGLFGQGGLGEGRRLGPALPQPGPELFDGLPL